jgi:coenzyme F420-reducing hydrogenase alpha subunit
VYLLHAPDFLGYQDAIQLAQDHREVVERGLKMKKTGNELVTLIGGREIHPVNVRVGGFYRVPRKNELREIREKLLWARDAACETVRFTSTLDFPDFDKDYEFVALCHPDEYPFNEGRLVSNKCLDIDISEYDDHFEEQHVEHSNALHSVIKERGAYFVGPLARYALNADKLPEMAKAVAAEVSLEPTCRNPFRSIIVRSVETVFACEEAIRIIDDYEMPDAPAIEIEPRAGTGWGCTEAPRGILHHSYALDDEGSILEAKIVPPTSQNQKTIEDDLFQMVPRYKELSDDDLTWRCEQAIRNYDPCISCATHFLKLNVERT